MTRWVKWLQFDPQYSCRTLLIFVLIYLFKKLLNQINVTVILRLCYISLMIDYIQIITTVENEDNAKKIAELLVDRRLAACVQIAGPIMSRFWWEGKIDTAEEYQIIIKSRNDLFPEIESVITDAHPYEVPEILAIPIFAAGKGYLNWISKELKK